MEKPVRNVKIALCSVFMLVAIWSVSWLFQPKSTNSTNPILRTIKTIELGEIETGQIVNADFDITNDGNAPLMIDGVRTSCACAGVEAKNPDGTFTQLTTLTVPPASSVPARMRLVVNGPVGAELKTVIYLTTNDPLQPEVQVLITLKKMIHGSKAVPEVLALGTVSIGEPIRRIVDIVDRSPMPRTIQRIETTDGSTIRATQLPVPENEAAAHGGRIIARIQVEISSLAISDIDGRVNVWLTTEKLASPVSIRIIGRIAPAAEIAPTTLVLPLRSDDGPIFRGTVLCRSQSPITGIRVIECPAYYTVSLPELKSPVNSVQIMIEKVADSDPPSQTVIKVGITSNGMETVCQLLVLNHSRSP